VIPIVENTGFFVGTGLAFTYPVAHYKETDKLCVCGHPQNVHIHAVDYSSCLVCGCAKFVLQDGHCRPASDSERGSVAFVCSRATTGIFRNATIVQKGAVRLALLPIPPG